MKTLSRSTSAIEKNIFQTRKIKQFFFVKKKNRSFRINLSDVLFVKADGASVIVTHTKGSDITYANLSSFQRQINYPYLFRVQRSYVVNLLNVTSFNDEHLFIEQNGNEHAVPLGRKYRKSVLEHYVHLKSS